MAEDNNTRRPKNGSGIIPEETPGGLDDNQASGFCAKVRSALGFVAEHPVIPGGISMLVLCVVLVLSLAGPDPQAPAPPATRPGEAPADMAAPPVQAGDNGTYQDFEEILGAPLESVIKQVDYALTSSLILTGYGPFHLHIKDTRLETFHEEPYLVQDLELELDGDAGRFLNAFGSALEKWAPHADLAHDDGMWTVAVAGRITHIIRVKAAPVPAPASSPRARLALVIDDMGRDLTMARSLAALPQPPTFSILPHTPHTAEVAALARDKGLEIMLHLPMEPKGYPEVDPGPGALFTDMSAQAVRAAVKDLLKLVPGAQGANNHMGSMFTENARGMACVMAELAGRDLFFLDSLTTPKSTGSKTARDAGVRFFKRNIFLDNVRDVTAITRQLDKAARIARISGRAVAIGHPYPETLAALKIWQRDMGDGLKVVPVSQLAFGRPTSSTRPETKQ